MRHSTNSETKRKLKLVNCKLGRSVAEAAASLTEDEVSFNEQIVKPKILSYSYHFNRENKFVKSSKTDVSYCELEDRFKSLNISNVNTQQMAYNTHSEASNQIYNFGFVQNTENTTNFRTTNDELTQSNTNVALHYKPTNQDFHANTSSKNYKFFSKLKNPNFNTETNNYNIHSYHKQANDALISINRSNDTTSHDELRNQGFHSNRNNSYTYINHEPSNQNIYMNGSNTYSDEPANQAFYSNTINENLFFNHDPTYNCSRSIENSTDIKRINQSASFDTSYARYEFKTTGGGAGHSYQNNLLYDKNTVVSSVVGIAEENMHYLDKMNVASTFNYKSKNYIDWLNIFYETDESTPTTISNVAKNDRIQDIGGEKNTLNYTNHKNGDSSFLNIFTVEQESFANTLISMGFDSTFIAYTIKKVIPLNEAQIVDFIVDLSKIKNENPGISVETITMLSDACFDKFDTLHEWLKNLKTVMSMGFDEASSAFHLVKHNGSLGETLDGLINRNL